MSVGRMHVDEVHTDASHYGKRLACPVGRSRVVLSEDVAGLLQEASSVCWRYSSAADGVPSCTLDGIITAGRAPRGASRPQDPRATGPPWGERCERA